MLTFKEIRTRSVILTLKRPIKAKIAYIKEWPILLIDLYTNEGLNLPENNASTLAGYIIYKTEALPEVGQTFKFNNIVYEIINKNKNQITQIKVFLDRST